MNDTVRPFRVRAAALVMAAFLAVPPFAHAGELYAAAIGEPPPRPPAPAKKPAPTPPPAKTPAPEPTPAPDTTAQVPEEEPAQTKTADSGLTTKILIGGAVALGLAALGGGGGGGGGGDAPPASTSLRSP